MHNGIELDLGHSNNVRVDADANTLTIGAAVRFRDVGGPLGEAKRELREFCLFLKKIVNPLTIIHTDIGSEPCVGMIGATLGGGVGRYTGLHGMIVNVLQSVKLVTAAGDIITASTTKSFDLFWGIRGARFNYATVLEATHTVLDQTAPWVLNADFLFPSNAS